MTTKNLNPTLNQTFNDYALSFFNNLLLHYIESVTNSTDTLLAIYLHLDSNWHTLLHLLTLAILNAQAGKQPAVLIHNLVQITFFLEHYSINNPSLV